AEEEQWNGVGYQVIETSVQQWGGEDADQAPSGPRNNAKVTERPSVKELQIKCRPHEEHQAERNHRASKPRLIHGYRSIVSQITKLALALEENLYFYIF